MKKFYFFVLITGLAFASCNNATETKEGETTESTGSENALTQGEVSFESAVYDFGTVNEGEIIEHVFKFTNTGTEPVIVSRVSASCGCTTPHYTSIPVFPDKEGEVTVKFDTNGQSGRQQKIVTVVSNGQNNVQTVQLRGTVN